MKTTKRENVRDGLHVNNLKSEVPFFVDELSYQDYCKLYSEALGVFEKIAGSYKTLGIGSLTTDVLHKISKHDFAEIEKNKNDEITENLKAFTNSEILATLRKNAEEPLYWFKIHTDLDLFEIDRIKRTHPGSDLDTDIYSIKAEAIIFGDEEKANLKEKYCTIRIDSQAKKEFLQLTETTLENLQAVKAILLKNGVNSIFGDGSLFSDTEGIVLNKSIMKFITK